MEGRHGNKKHAQQLGQEAESSHLEEQALGIESTIEVGV